MIAYAITNLVNGKKYIGITTKSLSLRWKWHLLSSNSKARRASSAISKAISLHGRENFAIEQIASASSLADLHAIERMLIKQERTLAPGGYNLTGGGDGVFSPSDELRRKMSLGQRARSPFSDETKNRISISLLGRAVSIETRNRISIALAGHVVSTETRQRMSVGRSGKGHSQEYKIRLSELTKGRPGIAHTEESKRKMSIARKGVQRAPLSDETKARISAANSGKKRTVEANEANRQRGLEQAARRVLINTKLDASVSLVPLIIDGSHAR